MGPSTCWTSSPFKPEGTELVHGGEVVQEVGTPGLHFLHEVQAGRGRGGSGGSWMARAWGSS